MDQLPEGFIDKDTWVEMGRDPAQWRDPEEFAERGEKINGILKKTNEGLKAELGAVRKDLEQFMQNQRELTERREKKAYERAKAEYEDKLSNLRKEKRLAVEEADGARYEAAEEAERALRPPEAPVEVQPEKTASDEFQAWTEKETWYGTKPELRDYADFLSIKYRKDVDAGKMTVSEALEKVASQVKTQFSHEFGNQRREAPPPVDGGGDVKRNGSKGFRDLPQDAKDAIGRFERQGLDRETLVKEYVDFYFGD